MSGRISFLPLSLVQDLVEHIEDTRNRDRDPSDPDGRYPLERLVERAFAAGYQDGFTRGRSSGRAVLRREYEERAKQDGATEAVTS